MAFDNLKTSDSASLGSSYDQKRVPPHPGPLFVLWTAIIAWSPDSASENTCTPS